MKKQNFSLLKVAGLAMLLWFANKSGVAANNNVAAFNEKAKTEMSKGTPKNVYPIYRVSELNEMADVAFEKKQYKKCIDLCDRVLITSSVKEYARACYTLGRAYSALGDYTRAITYLELAKKYYGVYGVSRPEKGVDYLAKYNAALQEVLDAKHNVSVVQSNIKSR